MKENTKTLLEGVSESTSACLLAMVQGNVLALTFSHLMIAAQTGVIAGVIAFAIGIAVKLRNRWITPLSLGICTSIVDYYIHPGSFGAAATEAIVTGIVAGLLSYLVSSITRARRLRNAA